MSPKITKHSGPSMAPVSFPVGMLPAGDDSQASSAESTVVGESLARPPQKAAKPKWVAYAESIGVDSSGSKQAIIDRVKDAEGG